MGEEQSIFQDARLRTTPLLSIANAFEELCEFLRSQRKGPESRLDTFCEACSLVSILFSCLDLAFKFAEQEYIAKDAASTAYGQVCAPHHSQAVRTAVYAGICTLPCGDQLLLRLNGTDHSAEKKMRRYINTPRLVVE